MVLGFAERYSIEKHEDRVVLLMRQRAHGLRLGAVCAVVLLGTWWIGPYGPQTTSAPRMPASFYWLWSGFFGFVCLLSLFAVPFYRKDVAITDDEVLVETGFYWSKSIERIRRGRPLRLWLETIVDDGEGVMFPYRVHFLDADGHAAGLFVEFQRRTSVDDMRRALQTAITLDVTGETPSS